MTTTELKQYIRNGKYAWPGGYPLYFVTSDNAALAFDTVKENYKEVLSAVKHNDYHSGWGVIRCEVNWEDVTLRCDHSGELIESAYTD